jgi:hypothetical protein
VVGGRQHQTNARFLDAAEPVRHLFSRRMPPAPDLDPLDDPSIRIKSRSRDKSAPAAGDGGYYTRSISSRVGSQPVAGRSVSKHVCMLAPSGYARQIGIVALASMSANLM